VPTECDWVRLGANECDWVRMSASGCLWVHPLSNRVLDMALVAGV